LIDWIICAERSLAIRSSGTGGAASGSAKYARQTRRIPSSARASSAPLRLQLVELARAGAHRLGRSPEDLLVEFRPTTVADRPEWIDAEHAEEAVRQRFGDVKGEVPTPRVTDYVRRLPAKRIEDASGILDVGRHRVRAFDGRRGLSPLLVPRDVVFFRELLGEIAQVVEAEARPAVQEENWRPLTRAEAGDQRLVVACRELGPAHGGTDPLTPWRNDEGIPRRLRYR
jgi:hypothetical protein